MNRQAKELQTKSRNHQVSLGAHRGTFLVTSASSGKRYTVWEMSDGGFRCSCEWAYWNPRDECSHTLSVREWLEASGNRSLSFWSTEQDAERQHRPTEWVSSGLWQTSRKTRMPRRETGYPMPVQYTRGRSKLFKC